MSEPTIAQLAEEIMASLSPAQLRKRQRATRWLARYPERDQWMWAAFLYQVQEAMKEDPAHAQQAQRHCDNYIFFLAHTSLKIFTLSEVANLLPEAFLPREP